MKKLLPFVCMVWLFGCTPPKDNKPNTGQTVDRSAILSYWASDIIIPSYKNYIQKLDTLDAKTKAFQSSPSQASLSQLRTAWVEAYKEWQKVELFEFGPAENHTLRNFSNIYPTDTIGIQTNWNDANANLDITAAYARQGFPALDYLINGGASSDNGIVILYTTDANATKRMNYLVRLVARLKSLTQTVLSEWQSGYTSTFTSKSGLDIGSSFGSVTNSYVLYYEKFIRAGKFGIPAGVMASSIGTANPQKVEAYYKKDISLPLAKIAHGAFVDFFNGKSVLSSTTGSGFATYLDAIGAKDSGTNAALSTTINTQFQVVTQKMNGLSDNLASQITTNNTPMVEIYSELQKAVRLMKVDMTSAMSITITYTDNDGD